VIPARAGFDLVVTTDALVEGVHFLPDDPLDLVARKLLRVNLSDLAAKAAEPFGYFLTTSWSPRCGPSERSLFAKGLAQDGEAYALALLGGDTVSTPGPLTLSATLLGWVPTGALVKRSGARPGDRLLVSGEIGRGALGLKARRGEIEDPGGAFAGHYQLPHPRLELREALRRHASAAADVSDGLVADAAHIADASGLAVTLELSAVPVPSGARDLAELLTAGDDYEIVCAASAGSAAALIADAAALGVRMTEIGGFETGAGVRTLMRGQPLELPRSGFQHPL
jgi:thiamine-monophosphate kinase